MSCVQSAVFGYKRPDHFARLLDSLGVNSEYADSAVHVFLDGARSPSDAERVARTRAAARDYAPRHTHSQRWPDMLAERGARARAEFDAHVQGHRLATLYESLTELARPRRISLA
jgi:hypothetical protein